MRNSCESKDRKCTDSNSSAPCLYLDVAPLRPCGAVRSVQNAWMYLAMCYGALGVESVGEGVAWV